MCLTQKKHLMPFNNSTYEDILVIKLALFRASLFGVAQWAMEGHPSPNH